MAPQAHAGRPLGRPGGAGRGGRVPGVGRVGLRQRPHPVRGRRDAGGRLTRAGPSAARRRRRPASAAAGPRGRPRRCRWPSRSSAPGPRASPSRCAAGPRSSAAASSGFAGSGFGSTSWTSRPAEPIQPSRSARTSAASSTTAPRAALTSVAVGLISRSSRSPIRWRVAGDDGTWSDTMSLVAEQLVERRPSATARRRRRVRRWWIDGHPEAGAPGARRPGRSRRSRRSRASRRTRRGRAGGRGRPGPSGRRAGSARLRASGGGRR